MAVAVREALAADREALVRFRCDLWPDATRAEHEEDVDAHLAGRARSTLPIAILVAVDGGAPLGFVEVGLRSHADGCDSTRPVGFVEGWYVAPTHRRRGVGRALVAAAEEWARGHGCREIASDTWSDARGETSVTAHQALGFEVVDRVVNFRKGLA
jgi:aminoglycoside 6'-N-acetyltransferase I